MLKKFIKKVVVFTTVATMVLPVATYAGTNSGTEFNDVKSTDWCYKAVKELSDKNIIVADKNGNFNPNAPIKEAEFVKLVHNATAPESVKNPAPTSNKWYSGYYSIWLTNFKPMLVSKDKEFGVLPTDYSQFGKEIRKAEGRSHYYSEVGDMYNWHAIPEDTWLAYVKDPNNMSDTKFQLGGTREEQWNGNEYGVYYHDLSNMEHRQFVNYQTPESSFSDLNMRVFNESHADRVTTRYMAGYILNEYIRNYKVNMGKSSDDNKINLMSLYADYYGKDFTGLESESPEFLASTANMLYWGMMSVDSNGNFHGKNSLTRAEAATIVCNLMHSESRKANADRMQNKMETLIALNHKNEIKVSAAIENYFRDYEESLGLPRSNYNTNNIDSDWDRLASESNEGKVAKKAHNIRMDMLFFDPHHGAPTAAIIDGQVVGEAGSVAYKLAGKEFTGENGEIIARANGIDSPWSDSWNDQSYVNSIGERLFNGWLNSEGHKCWIDNAASMGYGLGATVKLGYFTAIGAQDGIYEPQALAYCGI